MSVARWGAVALVLLCGVAAADPPRWTLASAIERTDFVYSTTNDGSYVVVFKPEKTDEVEHWTITIREVANAEWVLVFCTMLESDPENSFSEALLKNALTYTGRAAGSKFALDPDFGDLDVQYEIPFVGLTPELLRVAIMDVAATCDGNRERMADY